MQGPTHVIAGVLVQKSFDGIKNQWVRVPLIAITGLFFHCVFDRIARLTYHPPDPDFKSVFWVSYHLVVLIGFIVSLYYFWKPYKLGIIFSILPDFDWVIKHGSSALDIQSSYPNGFIHNCIHWFVDRIPPFSFLQYLPDYTHLPYGIALEVGLIVVMLLVINRLNRRLH